MFQIQIYKELLLGSAVNVMSPALTSSAKILTKLVLPLVTGVREFTGLLMFMGIDTICVWNNYRNFIMTLIFVTSTYHLSKAQHKETDQKLIHCVLIFLFDLVRFWGLKKCTSTDTFCRLFSSFILPKKIVFFSN